MDAEAKELSKERALSASPSCVYQHSVQMWVHGIEWTMFRKAVQNWCFFVRSGLLLQQEILFQAKAESTQPCCSCGTFRAQSCPVRWPQEGKVCKAPVLVTALFSVLSLQLWPWPGQESWTLISFRLRIPKGWHCTKRKGVWTERSIF